MLSRAVNRIGSLIIVAVKKGRRLPPLSTLVCLDCYATFTVNGVVASTLGR